MHQRHSRALVALLALLVLPPDSSHAFQEEQPLGEVLKNGQMARATLAARANRTRTSGAAPDTVYLGHSYTDHTGAPGPIVNYWNIYTGGYRPGVNDPTNAIWDWDHSTGFGAYVGDSLAGWWPIRRPYGITGGLVLADNQRPWHAIQIGNQGNYVINQGAGGKRTFGVTGYWHDDAGIGQGSAVTWSPISGGRSAWCGLRQHGDVSAMDLVTGNAYNQTTQMYGSEGDGGTGVNSNFPGYANHMDQMLYRDIAATPGQSLSIGFSYRTYLSTGVITTASTRTGWFDKDPLAVTAGNFISATAAGAAAPIDSFMVYIGSPANDAGVRLSDGTTAPVFDLQRRWFSEVLRVNEGSAPYYQMLSTFGINGDTLSGSSVAHAAAIPSSIVDNILNTAGNPGAIRLVFRVKTNQSFSDTDSRIGNFSSRGHGAAIIDNVSYAIGAGANVVIGDFETPQQGGANSIDNQTGVSALTNWKSTGKPPAIYFHTKALDDLQYADLCGPPDSPSRSCNIGGVVMTAGNNDDLERHGDSRYLSDREVMHSMVSPTINLVTAGPSTPNNMGLTGDMVNATDDIYIWYDMYAGMFNLAFSGNAWTFSGQSYPATQTINGALTWGAARYPGFQIINPEPQCFIDWEPLYGFGLVATSNPSNPSGTPDSLRVSLGVNQQCFRFAISLGCNSADGAYFDNVSLAFVDLPATQTSAANAITLGPITASIWNFYNDAFPANETNGLTGTASFDTLGAWLQTGINNYPITGSVFRNDIPGDTAVVQAGNAVVSSPDDPTYAQVRVDMVFRVLPGPGNYRIAAGRTFPPAPFMQLLTVPTDQAGVVVPGVYNPSPSAGAQNFFSSFIVKPGAYAKGDHFGNTRWDHLTWNSVRCDTAEANRFPVSGIGVSSLLTLATYASMYHEEEFLPAGIRPEVGIAKKKCFLINPASTTVTHSNIDCNTVPAWVTSGAPGNGYNGSPTTQEHTKIIPDGLLTAGAHVQYFFRKSHAVDPLLSIAMCPDTNLIFPQSSEGSSDGHRWQQFGVLPDRWKEPSFGGAGMACLLFVDNNDRRGNERVWVSVMDSIGGTSLADAGNHNGWARLPKTTDYSGLPITDPSVAPGVVHGKNKNAGTTWDMYGVKASESLTTQAGAFGSRLAAKAIGVATGKDSRQGPTPTMLRTYYRMVALLSGDLSSGVLGPFPNRSQNDIALLNDFLQTPGGTAQPRGLLVSGDGFVQSETQTGGIDPAHTDFLAFRLGLTLRNGSYQAISGNVNLCADLLTTHLITNNADTYGVSNSCLWSNDLLQRNSGIGEAYEAVFYESAGINGPYAAAIIKPSSGLRPWVALTEGWDMEHAFSRYCENSNGRLAYYYHMLGNVFGSLCRFGAGPGGVLDSPQIPSGALFVDFMKIGNNVLRAGAASVTFGLARADLVDVTIHDVTGRRVRTLAKRHFAAGEHSLQWDGSADDGSRSPRGVYFARLNSSGQTADLTGRVVVLR